MKEEKSDNCFGIVDQEVVDSNVEQATLNQLFKQGQLFSDKDVEKFTSLEDPRIYGFIVLEINEANGFCAIKIGDTYRTVNIRLSEWRKIYSHLRKVFDIPAYVDIEKISETDKNETYVQRYYFRDYVIHRALREHGHRHLVYPKTTNPEIVYQGNVVIPESGVNTENLSEEFMIQPSRIGEDSETIINETIQKINEIVENIKLSIINGENKYEVSTTPYKKDDNKTSDFSSMTEWDYKKYPYQEKASCDLVEKFIRQHESRIDDNEPVKVLLDAPTRSGKTAMISWSLKKIFYRIWNAHYNDIPQKELIVFTTGIPDVFYEFQEFIQRHKDVKNFITWFDKDDLISDFSDNNSVENPIDKAWKDNNVIAVSASLQYLAGRKDNGGVKDLHKIIENRVSIVVADECHYGLFGNGESYKESFKSVNTKGNPVLDKTLQEKDEIVDVEVIEKELFSLNPKYGYIFASATTYNILDNDAFSHDNVVFVHQSDVDSERDKSFKILEQQGRPVEKSAFFGRVNRHFFGIDVDAPLNELFEVEEINDKNNNNKKFIFKNKAAYNVLDALFGIGEYKNVPALMNNEVLRKAGAGRNILFQMASRKACDALENYFMNRKDELNFNVMNTSSFDGNKPWTKAGIQKIKKEFHNRRFGYNIMITVNRGTTGVSIPQLDTEILLNSSNSLVRRVQTHGRVNTPWVETIDIPNDDGTITKKKICYKPNTFVIDFDAAALYNIENDQEILNRNTGNNEKPDGTSIGTIWTFNGLTLSQMTQLDIHKQLDEYTKKESISTLVKKVPLPDIEFSDFKLLDGFDLKKTKGKINVAINKKGKELAKRQANRSTNAVDKEEESDPNSNNRSSGQAEEDQLEKQKLILSYIWERTYLYALLNVNVNNLQDIIEDLRNKKDRTLINDLDMMLFLSYYENVVSGRNFGTLDSLERGIKAIQARSKDNNGCFSAEGFFECVMGLNRISSNEVFTPQTVADMLLDRAGFDNLENLEDFSNNSKTLIDNADKSGIIVSSMVKRLQENNLPVNVDSFYSIPTSPVAYQITYRIFEELGLNTDNILFVREIDALLMNKILVAMILGKDFDKIDDIENSLKARDFWEKLVSDIEEFDYCISNPPYQEDVNSGNQYGNRSAKDIYHLFQMNASVISKATSMIYPASWQKNIDKNLGLFLLNNGLKESYYYDSQDVFDQAIRKNFPISVVICEKGYNDDLTINDINAKRDLEVWIDSEPKLILFERIKNLKKINYGLKNTNNLSNVFTSDLKFTKEKESLNDPISIYIKQKPGKQADGSTWFVERDDLLEMYPNTDLETYRVCVQSAYAGRLSLYREAANGKSGNLGHKVYEPNTTHSMTWSELAKFNTRQEAENFVKYMNTKTVTTILGFDFSRATFGSFVPDLEDYTNNNSFIQWEQPLDPQLYNFFNLTKKEIEIIEK